MSQRPQPLTTVAAPSISSCNGGRTIDECGIDSKEICDGFRLGTEQEMSIAAHQFRDHARVCALVGVSGTGYPSVG
jgi:hypothetical protein